MQAFPPADRIRRTSSASLRSACSMRPPPTDADPSCPGAAAGWQAGEDRIEHALTPAPARVNGWTLTFHVFDYNLDHLGPGTIDDPAWKITDRTTATWPGARRRAGLWGNHGYEAAYAMPTTDADGDHWTGAPLRLALRPAPRRGRVLVDHHVRPARASTWSPTRSAATRSATARPGLRYAYAGRSPS